MAAPVKPPLGLLPRLLRGLVLVVAGTYVGMGAVLYFLQDALIFPAPGGIEGTQLDDAARELGATPVRVEAEDGVELYGWHRPAGGARAIVFFHGNGETVAGNLPLLRLATQEGWDYVAFAYRGYPGSQGVPSEEGLATDARAVWDYVVDGASIPPGRVVLHGRSLGGGVATRLAEERNPAALVLESTFTSVLDVVREKYPMYPAKLLLKHPFDTRSRAARVGVPVLVLHGATDPLVPVAHGRELPTLFADAQYVEAPDRGHNTSLIGTVPAVRDAYVAFLKRFGG